MMTFILVPFFGGIKYLGSFASILSSNANTLILSPERIIKYVLLCLAKL
jgi:hypothetical protein